MAEATHSAAAVVAGESAEDGGLLGSGWEGDDGFTVLGGEMSFSDEGEDPWDEATIGLPNGHEGGFDGPHEDRGEVLKTLPASATVEPARLRPEHEGAAEWGAGPAGTGPDDGGRQARRQKEQSDGAADEAADVSQEIWAAVDASEGFVNEEPGWTPFEDGNDEASSGFEDPWGDKTTADPGADADDDGPSVFLTAYDEESLDVFDLGDDADESEAREPDDGDVPPEDRTIDQVTFEARLVDATIDQSALARAVSDASDGDAETDATEGRARSFNDDRTVAYEDAFSNVPDRDDETVSYRHAFGSVEPDDDGVPENTVIAPTAADEAPTLGMEPADEPPEHSMLSDFSTVRSMSEEPERPGRPDIRPAPIEQTVAGVTQDFIRAGVEPPADGGYDPLPDAPLEPASEVLPPFAPPRRGGALGAIRLGRRSADPDEAMTEFAETGEDEMTVGDPMAELAGGPVQDVEDSIFELEIDHSAEPVRPSPLEAPPGEEDDNSSYQEEYSALVAPPEPLMPAPAGADAIGSTNVPPANLSLSQVLAHPASASRARLTAVPRTMPDNEVLMGRPGSLRSPSMVGRRIREVVRSNDAPPVVLGRPPPSEGPRLDLQSALDAPASEPDLAIDPMPPNRKWLAPVLAVLSALLLAVAVYLALPYVAGPGGPHLTIKTNPIGARVLVDGAVQKGATPITISGLRPGVTYQIRLERTGYESVQREVQLPSDGPLIWQIPLRPASVQK